jgi:hypothetical protein
VDVAGRVLRSHTQIAGAGRRAISGDPGTAADSLTNIQATLHLAEQQLDDLASLTGPTDGAGWRLAARLPRNASGSG